MSSRLDILFLSLWRGQGGSESKYKIPKFKALPQRRDLVSLAFFAAGQFGAVFTLCTSSALSLTPGFS